MLTQPMYGDSQGLEIVPPFVLIVNLAFCCGPPDSDRQLVVAA
jgi:hypothetical protein